MDWPRGPGDPHGQLRPSGLWWLPGPLTERAMTANRSEPIRYIERTRTYYSALGYPPYTWAQFDSVAFSPIARPVKQSRLALVSTAARFDPALGDQGPGAPYNASAKFYRVYEAPIEPAPNLRISHLGYDRAHTTAEDMNSYLPLERLQEAVADGRIGSLAEKLIGVPTNRSQRVTREQDAPDVLEICRAQHAELALLVPS